MTAVGRVYGAAGAAGVYIAGGGEAYTWAY